MNISITNLVKADIFAGIFQHIKVFTDNVNIIFDKDSISLQTMDNSRISIFEVKIPATWFDTYTHTAQSSIAVGISSIILFKILNARDKSQNLQIIYNEGATDSLEIHFLSLEGSKTVCYDKHFVVPLIDMEVDNMNIPDIDYSAEFSLPATVFSALVNQLKQFGETLEIQCSEQNIFLVAHSLESGKMSVEIKNDDLTEFAIVEGDELNLSYSLNYLHNICLYNKLAKEIGIHLCANYPLRIDYDLGEGASIRFYLAPKIGDDE